MGSSVTSIISSNHILSPPALAVNSPKHSKDLEASESEITRSVADERYYPGFTLLPSPKAIIACFSATILMRPLWLSVVRNTG